MEKGDKIAWTLIFIVFFGGSWFIKERNREIYIKKQTAESIESFRMDLTEVGFSKGQIDSIFNIADVNGLKIIYDDWQEQEYELERISEYWYNNAR